MSPEATRDGFGKALLELVRENRQVVALDCGRFEGSGLCRSPALWALCENRWATAASDEPVWRVGRPPVDRTRANRAETPGQKALTSDAPALEAARPRVGRGRDRWS